MYREVLQHQPSHFDALHLLGVIAFQTRHTERAVELIGKAIALKPDYVEAHNNCGVALRDLKRPEDALASFDRAIALKPDYIDALNNRGNALLDLKRPAEALASFDRAIGLKPDYAEVHNNRGNALLDLKRPEEALASFDRAIALKRDYVDAHNNRGNALLDLKRPAEALASFDRAIALNPDYAEVHNNRGNALLGLKCPEDALASVDRAIALKQDYVDAHNNRGNALLDLKQPEEALASFDRAIALKPDYAEAHNNRGNALLDLKRPGDALASYDKAIALKRDYAEAHNNYGNALLDLKRPEDALASYDRAIALKPDYAEAYFNRGNALLDLKRPEDALATYNKGITLKPDHAEAYFKCGNALQDLMRPAYALSYYEKAIALKPDHARAYSRQGWVLAVLSRYDEAIAAYDKAFALDPGAEGERLNAKLQICDWSNIDSEFAHLIAAIRNGNSNTPPFIFLAIPSSSAEQLECAKLWVAKEFPYSDTPIWQGDRYDHDRIRVAYLSADFRDHPTSQLLVGVIEHHDRERFEAIGISFGPEEPNEMRTRLQGSFERFIDVKGRSNLDVAKLLRTLEVDIAVDLMGFTTHSRTAILAHRPSAIQVNFLGYPGTMGASYIDYMIADSIVIPESSQPYYAEKLVYLPNSYLPTSYQMDDSKHVSAGTLSNRVELGLPQKGIVFCCFNRDYKILPQVFDSWMRILSQVEGSVLWLFADNANAAANLRKEAAARSVDPQRLVFASHMSRPDHLARHRVGDLFLDTRPYNAHTTTADALWAGLPVLTCPGDTFASRVAASLLNAAGLPELITTTLEAYEQMAIELATDREKLAAIKHKLAINRLTAPLFDTKLFTKHIEAAYTAMYKRHQMGLPPDHIYVPQ